MKNYKTLIKQFWKYNERQKIGATAIAFYLFLLEKFNQKGNNFMLTDREIMKNIGISNASVKPLKQKLQKLGLINFQIPQKTSKGTGTRYEIIFEYSFTKEKKIKENLPTEKPVSDFQGLIDEAQREAFKINLRKPNAIKKK